MGYRDERTNASKADTNIRKVLNRLTDALTDDLGFTDRRNGGDKYRLTSRADDGTEIKITARPNYTHGEGRICFEVYNDGVQVATSEVRVSGRISVHDEAETCRRKMVLLVRRAGVEVIEQGRIA